MSKPTSYLPLHGKWTRENDDIVFNGAESGSSHGLALFGRDMTDGLVEVDIALSGAVEKTDAMAMVVFRAKSQEHFYAAGVGGRKSLYSLLEVENLREFNTLVGVGSCDNIEPDRVYKVKVAFEGQKVDVFVDSTNVISYPSLPRTAGASLGVLCLSGTPKATFRVWHVDSVCPKAFVAMPFSEPYNEVYRDAVEPLVKDMGFTPLRMDDVYGPGVIINDIFNNLSESAIVLAEISERNPNVYYELGLAHALGKPALLMAKKNTQLPFDISPYRCIYYEDSIAGRARLLEAMRSHLTSLLGRNIGN